MVVPQKTLKNAIHCSGVGLHTGAAVRMTLRPALANTGIVFRSVGDDGSSVDIPAHWSHAIETSLCTALGASGGRRVMTIEHVMAALAGCAIDNCIVEIDGPEIPIMDGSADPFVFLIDCAGTVEQAAPRRMIHVLKTVRVGNDDAWAMIEPDSVFSIDFEIDFADPTIGRQSASFVADAASFKSEISGARTFGFLADVDRLRKDGKALGASLENAVVIDAGQVVNVGGLRFGDEFVRHKILDAIGDLALAGMPLVGHFSGFRSSHALNRQLLRALLSDETAWTNSVSLPPVSVIPSLWSEPARIRA